MSVRVGWLLRLVLVGAALLLSIASADAQGLGKCDPTLLPPRDSIDTFAGSGPAEFDGGGFGGDGGLGTDALLKFPGSVATDGSYLYIADTGNDRVRRLNLTTCIIDTVAGRGPAPPGTRLWAGDGGPATSAYLNAPRGVAVANGYLYISDTNNHRIRRVDLLTGLISTIAGVDFEFDYNGDGIQATTAALNAPWQLVVSDGFLFVAVRGYHRVRRIDLATGLIDTVAGNGEQGFGGDGGLARNAQLDFPLGVAVAHGAVWIADYMNRRLRRVDLATGIVTTASGSGFAGVGGDGGPAATADLSPDGLAAWEDALFVSDPDTQRVLRFDLSTGIMASIVGLPFAGGFSGDGGPGKSAAVRNPSGLVVANGGLFIADVFNQRVRRLQLIDPLPRNQFEGFDSPVAMPGPGTLGWNEVNAHQTVPLKWAMTLGGSSASAPDVVGIFSMPIDCTTGNGTGSVVQEANESGPRHQRDGRWHYNWKIPSSYANSCRAIYVKFSDNTTSPSANFNVR